MWLRDLLLKKKVFSSLNKNKRTGISRFAVMVLASVLMCGGSQVFALSCSVGSSSWNNGYLVNVTVLNDGNSSVSQWAVQLHYQQTPAVANYWSADITTSGKVVAAGNLAWNGNLAPGQSTTFGIVGTHTGSFSEPSCTTDTASSSSTSASSSSSSSSRSSIASASSVSVNSSSYSYGSYGYSSYSGAVASSVPGGISGIAPPVSTSSVASVAPEIDAEETHFYLSYDDSGSTAPRDLTFAALEYGLRPSASYGRAYEFLNAENFPHFAANTLNPFTVSMGLIQVPQTEIPVNIDYQGDMYALGVNISGPTLSKQERKNVVLTVLLDISGSMDGSYAREVRNDVRTLLDVAKHGLTQMMSSLKEGDVLNLVTFETSAHIVLTDWQFDATDSTYTDVVNGLATRGSTNLNQGIEYAYTVANASYDPAKANRVVILTDAYANTGEVVPEIIAEKTVINGMEGILFSGVGIGAEFNEGFLNKLTDIGKSTYSAMVTPTDAERIFTGGFMRFVDHAVENIQFRVDYPQSLDQLKSAAEEISTEPSEVSTVNFSYNSSQFFLEMFSGKDVDTSATITLTATFDGADGAPATITLEKTLAELLAENSDQIYAAAAVTTLADLVAGKIDCEAVLASGLYSMNVEADVYVTYIDAITDFCGLAVSTGYSSSSSDVSSYGSVSSASTSSFGYVTGSVSSASSAPIYTYP